MRFAHIKQHVSMPITTACMAMLLLLTPTGKWARGGWAASDEDEKRVKEETQVGLHDSAHVQGCPGRICVGRDADAFDFWATSRRHAAGALERIHLLEAAQASLSTI